MNKAKSIKVEYHKQQDNTVQLYSRLHCSPVFPVAAGPVMFIDYFWRQTPLSVILLYIFVSLPQHQFYQQAQIVL